MSMGISNAFAASITISRDDSYDGTGDGNVYKYYKVFSASYESNTSTGGGSDAGAPGDITASASAEYINLQYNGKQGLCANKIGGNVQYGSDSTFCRSEYSVKHIQFNPE